MFKSKKTFGKPQEIPVPTCTSINYLLSNRAIKPYWQYKVKVKRKMESRY